jgi:YbbR domain-containing protein
MVYHPFRHLGLKFLSVAVAFGLWLAVAGEQTVERSLRVPLELRNRPGGLELVGDVPATVDVRVSGTSGFLSQLGQGDVLAIVDLAAAKSGRRYFHLTRSQVRAPFGIEVGEVTPGTILLNFERSIIRRVPVEPILEGEPSPGYAVAGRPSVTPTEVDVAGPQSVVMRLKSASTEPVSVAGARAAVKETVAIGVQEASLRLASPGVAVVTVPISPMPVERTVTQVPIRLRNLGTRVSAQAVPSTVAVTARGPKEVVEALRSDSLLGFVDLAGLGPGQYNLTVRVEPPHEAVTVHAEPATVRVRIR